MTKYCFLFLTSIVLTGCYDPNAQHSAIVRRVQLAGAGNLSTYSYPGLVEWFSRHPEMARDIAQRCASASLNKPANWAISSEGTTCKAAAGAQPPPDFRADTRAW